MAFKYNERVRESSTTTGTGDIVLGGAPNASYQAFSAVMSDGDTTDVVVFSNTEYQAFRATYNSGANSLSRGTTYASSNSGADVSFSAGTKIVIMGLPGTLIDEIINNANALLVATHRVGGGL